MGGGSRLLWVMGLGTIKILDHPSTVKIIMKVGCLDLADVCDFFHSGVPMGYCGLRGGGVLQDIYMPQIYICPRYINAPHSNVRIISQDEPTHNGHD